VGRPPVQVASAVRGDLRYLACQVVSLSDTGRKRFRIQFEIIRVACRFELRLVAGRQIVVPVAAKTQVPRGWEQTVRANNLLTSRTQVTLASDLGDLLLELRPTDFEFHAPSGFRISVVDDRSARSNRT